MSPKLSNSAIASFRVTLEVSAAVALLVGRYAGHVLAGGMAATVALPLWLGLTPAVAHSATRPANMCG